MITYRVQSRDPYPETRIPKRGFTLIEVMLAAVIIALGTVLIYESFFISLDAFAYYSRYLSVASWMDERLWQEQDSFMRTNSSSILPLRGELITNNKKCTWEVGYAGMDDERGLFRTDIVVSWKEGQRNVRLSRTGYALYRKE